MTLSYDPLGRLSKIAGSGIADLSFVEDPGSLDAIAADYVVSTGNLYHRYVFGPGADEPIVDYDSTGARTWLIADERGSIIARPDANGNASASRVNSYDEYGVPGASNSGRYGYTGQAALSEIGLDYYKARMYLPTLGRFLQTDPAGSVDSPNLYAYVLNDPVNNFDPTGLDCDSNTTVCNCRDPSKVFVGSSSGGICLDLTDFKSQDQVDRDPGEPAPGGQAKSPVVQAPKQKPTKQQCIGSALKKNALSLGLDIAGVVAEFALPEVSLTAGVIGSMYVGAASLGNSLAHKDIIGGALAGGGRHAGMAEGFFSGSALSFARTLSIGTLALSTVRDIAQTKSDFENCMSGKVGP